MNKIYNNLSIENLIKTDWFNQFSISQKQVIEIRKGLHFEVNPNIYAKTKFSSERIPVIIYIINISKKQ